MAQSQELALRRDRLAQRRARIIQEYLFYREPHAADCFKHSGEQPRIRALVTKLAVLLGCLDDVFPQSLVDHRWRAAPCPVNQISLYQISNLHAWSIDSGASILVLILVFLLVRWKVSGSAQNISFLLIPNGIVLFLFLRRPAHSSACVSLTSHTLALPRMLFTYLYFRLKWQYVGII